MEVRQAFVAHKLQVPNMHYDWSFSVAENLKYQIALLVVLMWQYFSGISVYIDLSETKFNSTFLPYIWRKAGMEDSVVYYLAVYVQEHHLARQGCVKRPVAY